MDTFDLFDIRTVSRLPFELPDTQPGTIFLLGDSAGLAETASQVETQVLSGMDKSMTSLRYTTRIADIPVDATDTGGCNIACVIHNPLTGRREFVTAYAEQGMMPLAVSELVNQAETVLKERQAEALIVNALYDPQAFRDAVDMAITPNGLWEEGLGKVWAIGGFAPGAAGGFSKSLLRRDWLGADKENEKKLRNLSARERKEMFRNLPVKVTASFEKRDPDTSMFIKEVIDNMTPAEKTAILESLLTRHNHAVQDVIMAMVGGASRYELVVRPRDPAPVRIYKDKVRYIAYIRDEHGHEEPLVFKHAPSYCLYLLHAIDRCRRRDDIRVLDLSQNREAFCKLYSTLFDTAKEGQRKKDEQDKEKKDKQDEDEQKNVERIYDEIKSRVITKDGVQKERPGRYDEYIKDIHLTLESMLGVENSIPFKIGDDRFLALSPSKIKLPPELTEMIKIKSV